MIYKHVLTVKKKRKIKLSKKSFLEHTYNPDKCDKVLEKLKKCCLEHGAQSPVVCSGFPTSKSSSSK